MANLMEHKEVSALLDRAIQHFGEEHQLKKLAEECSELSTAILRLTNGCDGHTEAECNDAVLEEVVDVSIMIEQVFRILRDRKTSDGRDIFDIINYKLTRLEQRIDAGKVHAETGTA